MCWGSVPNISASYFYSSRRHYLFFVAFSLAGNPAVFTVPYTVGLVGAIVPFLVVALVSWLGRARDMLLLSYNMTFVVAVAPTWVVLPYPVGRDGSLGPRPCSWPPSNAQRSVRCSRPGSHRLALFRSD